MDRGKGFVYHRPGQLTGDYDEAGTEEEILDLIRAEKGWRRDYEER